VGSSLHPSSVAVAMLVAASRAESRTSCAYSFFTLLRMVGHFTRVKVCYFSLQIGI
jgi:hypothetical protein